MKVKIKIGNAAPIYTDLECDCTPEAFKDRLGLDCCSWQSWLGHRPYEIMSDGFQLGETLRGRFKSYDGGFGELVCIWIH